MTPTIELICGHRSIRHFTDEPISDAQCEAIINSARATSSSVEWVNGQEGNTRWGGIIRKNLCQEAIVEKQCDRYSI